jgi:glycerophosphoryl diester phosphodiesterase/endonuclease/exonuclease/phosphatase family metal-dependent hydrolase
MVKFIVLLFLPLFFLINNIGSGMSQTNQEQGIRIMSYNIRYGSLNSPNAWPDRKPVMLELLNQYEPDLIGMQEALYFQIKDLESALLKFRWIGLGRNGGSKSEYMVVFYNKERLEPMEYDFFWLSDYPDIVGSTTWGNTNRRMVTWILFQDKLTKSEFYFVNTHFDHQIERARVLSARLLISKLENFRKGIPIILAGDFNAAAEQSEPYTILVGNGPFLDSWKTAAKREGEELNTFNNFQIGSHSGGRRIDWILYQGELDVLYSEIIDFFNDNQYPSDHFPVIADIRIPTKRPQIFFQAHRGAIDEAPENTLAAIKHAWNIPGAIPEIDLRATKDKELICIHDETLERTTNAPEEIRNKKISDLPYSQIKLWDAGIKFDKNFKGEIVPKLNDVLSEMVKKMDRQLYIDIKDESEIDQLKTLIRKFDVQKRIIFVSDDQEKLIELGNLFPDARTMTWLSGKPLEIKNNFEKLALTQFKGISQLQFHLQVNRLKPDPEMAIEPDYLKYALNKLKRFNIELQIRPLEFDSNLIKLLVDLGIKWYVTDAPSKFFEEIQNIEK